MTHAIVVEDDAAVRDLLADALADEGYRVSAASNGIEALDLVRADPPDVVLLDLTMPLLDGQEFADAWRTAVPDRRVPIVVVSGTSDLPPSLGALGVREHIRKPFDIEDVLTTVRRLVREPAATAEPGGQR